jgi:hypothetical protein
MFLLISFITREKGVAELSDAALSPVLAGVMASGLYVASVLVSTGVAGAPLGCALETALKIAGDAVGAAGI